MFCHNTPIPFYKLNATSFFDKPYKNINPSRRKKLFEILFNWERRKLFIMFLTMNNYIVKNNKN